MTLDEFTATMVVEGFYVQSLGHGAVLVVRPLTGRVYYDGSANIPCRLSLVAKRRAPRTRVDRLRACA